MLRMATPPSPAPPAARAPWPERSCRPGAASATTALVDVGRGRAVVVRTTGGRGRAERAVSSRSPAPPRRARSGSTPGDGVGSDSMTHSSSHVSSAASIWFGGPGLVRWARRSAPRTQVEVVRVPVVLGRWLAGAAAAVLTGAFDPATDDPVPPARHQGARTRARRLARASSGTSGHSAWLPQKSSWFGHGGGWSLLSRRPCPQSGGPNDADRDVTPQPDEASRCQGIVSISFVMKPQHQRHPNDMSVIPIDGAA